MRTLRSHVHRVAAHCAGIAFGAIRPVWVEPFTEANEQQQPDWINRTLHQALAMSLRPGRRPRRRWRKTRPADRATSSTAHDPARRTAELRVTGQVLDTESARASADSKRPARERELFAIQDSIGGRSRKVDRAAAKLRRRSPLSRPTAPAAHRSALRADPLRLSKARTFSKPSGQSRHDPPPPRRRSTSSSRCRPLYPVTPAIPAGYNPGMATTTVTATATVQRLDGYGGGNIIVVQQQGRPRPHGGRQPTVRPSRRRRSRRSWATTACPAEQSARPSAVSGFGAARRRTRRAPARDHIPSAAPIRDIIPRDDPRAVRQTHRRGRAAARRVHAPQRAQEQLLPRQVPLRNPAGRAGGIGEDAGRSRDGRYRSHRRRRARRRAPRRRRGDGRRTSRSSSSATRRRTTAPPSRSKACSKQAST